MTKSITKDNSIEEINWKTEVYQQLSKEKFQNDFILSHVRPDFFKKLNQYRKTAPKDELVIIDAMINQLLRIRIGKLLGFINQDNAKDIIECLSDEEFQFWEAINYAQRTLKEKVLHYG